MDSDITYSAFISYRRGGFDEVIAQALHKDLERYRTPRRLVRTGVPSRVGPVFLDTAEREASPDLDAALRLSLDASRWLLVICSKRTPKSDWVATEIEHFAASKPDKILVLLIDGEPDEAYPRALLNRLEPRAADIRAANPSEAVGKLRKSEKLALLAPMLGVRYDDLKLRERQRKRRQSIILASIVSILFVIFTSMLLMYRAEQLQSRLLEKLDNLEAAMQQKDHQSATKIATQALILDRDHRLGKRLEIERVIRRSFDLPFLRRPIYQSPNEIRTLTMSEDGECIALASRNSPLVVLEKQEHSFRPKDRHFTTEEVTALAYQDKTGLLAVGTVNGIVYLAESNKTSEFSIGINRVGDLAFSPANNLLAVAAESGLFLWRTNGSDQSPHTLHRSGPVGSIAFYGDWLASTNGNRIIIWQSTSKATLSIQRELTLPKGFEVNQVAFSPRDFRLVATAFSFDISSGQHGSVFEWKDFRNSAQAKSLYSGQDISLRAQFFKSGELLVSGAQTSMRVIGTDGSIFEPNGDLKSNLFVVGPKQEVILADRSSGEVSVLELTTRKLSSLKLEFHEEVKDLTYVGKTGNLLAAAYHGDTTPSLWNLKKVLPSKISLGEGEQPLFTIDRRLNRLTSVPSCPEKLVGGLNRFLHDSENLVVWNPMDLTNKGFSPVKHAGNVVDVSLTPSGEVIASIGSIEPIVKLYDFKEKNTAEIEIPTNAPLISVSTGMNSSGQWVAVGDQLGNIYLVNAETQKVTIYLKGGNLPMANFSIRFSPDGEWLAAGGSGGVQLFRTADKSSMEQLNPKLAVFDMEFSPDGKALFAVANDGSILRWFLDKPGWPVFSLKEPGPIATALAISPDNKTIAAGFTDGTIVIWPRYAELIAFLEMTALE